MIKWDKPCYKCLSHFCDLSCKEPKHLQAPQPKEPEQDQDEVDIRSRLYQRIHELETQLAQPEQEPMALQMDVIVVNLVREGINKHRARELAEHFIKHTAPPQRPWVGLTDEEIVHIGVATGLERVAVNMIEAKLKEKNT